MKLEAPTSIPETPPPRPYHHPRSPRPLVPRTRPDIPGLQNPSATRRTPALGLQERRAACPRPLLGCPEVSRHRPRSIPQASPARAARGRRRPEVSRKPWLGGSDGLLGLAAARSTCSRETGVGGAGRCSEGHALSKRTPRINDGLLPASGKRRSQLTHLPGTPIIRSRPSGRGGPSA
jgi:hypothetical protein